MFEKVSPYHPDVIADRIAGAMLDLAYSKQENPRVAVEVLIGHGECFIIAETSYLFTKREVREIVNRIAGKQKKLRLKVVPQDVHLAKNQEYGFHCGDNGIFKGVPVTDEQRELTSIAKMLNDHYHSDGKYILDGKKLIICQSYAKEDDSVIKYLSSQYDVTFNPLGYWTGGLSSDSGSLNRKLGSDMGDSITGGGLCLSGDSEYLGDDFKWYKMCEYAGGRVAEWDNGELKFVYPSRYIHNTDDTLIHIHNKSKLSMCLTPYHEMLIKTSKGNLIKRPTHIIAQKLYNQIGNSGEVLHSFIYKHEPTTSSYADENDYRLQVAFCADGTILNDQVRWNGRIKVKKECKKNRLRELLSGKDYKETLDGDYSIFWYKFPHRDKSLYRCFKDECWDILKEEIYFWDGNAESKVFRTTNKEDADFIQFVLQSYGYTSGILTTDCNGRKQSVGGREYTQHCILYTVVLYKSTTTCLRKAHESPITVDYLQGKHDSFCFEVESHNLVIRHNNKIFITGNCGKDLSKADVSINIYAWLKAQETGSVVELNCAIGDSEVDGKPFSEIMEIARDYINSVGGFEKFAEWGLIR